MLPRCPGRAGGYFQHFSVLWELFAFAKDVGMRLDVAALSSRSSPLLLAVLSKTTTVSSEVSVLENTNQLQPVASCSAHVFIDVCFYFTVSGFCWILYVWDLLVR